MLLRERENVGDRYAEVRAWDVPESDRYPDGVKYSLQYGTLEGETLIRYDNVPDHPGAAHHHKHTRDGDAEDVEPYFECTFHDPEQLHRVTRPKNLELLRTIAREEPAGIRETARLVDRDVRQVHRNLNELESLGLIDFEERGPAKRPTVWYDTIEVDLPPFGPDSGSDAADA